MSANLRVFKAADDEWSLEYEGKQSFLVHSAENPGLEGKWWAEHFQMESDTVYLILGCGLGYHIQALQQQLLSESKMIVIVPEEEKKWLLSLKENVPFQQMQHKEVLWISSNEVYDTAVTIADYMLENRLKRIQLCPYRPAMRVYEKFYLDCITTLSQQIENSMSLTLNVRFLGGKMFTYNYLQNLADISRSLGVDSMIGLFAKETPVVIVGSGPSLDKNIHILREMADDAVIIAAGSALVALEKAGITPHFFFVVDGTPKMYEVVKEALDSEAILAASCSVNHDIVSEFTGEMVFFLSRDMPVVPSILRWLPATRSLMQAASVSTVAVDFARICGSRKIILVGQDLSYPYGQERHHADGVETSSYEGEEAILVPGYFEDKVKTYTYLKVIIDYFASYVNNFPYVEFINATEGGAKIGTMKQLSLQAVAEDFRGKKWGIKTKQKLRKVFLKRKTIKKPSLLKELERQAINLELYVEKLQSVDQAFLGMTSEQLLKLYVPLFEKEAIQPVEEVLQHVITPRLQTIDFFRQEGVADSEICIMYQNMVRDMVKFAREMVDILRENCKIIGGEL